MIVKEADELITNDKFARAGKTAESQMQFYLQRDGQIRKRSGGRNFVCTLRRNRELFQA